MTKRAIQKLILFQNGIETLDFFTHRLKNQFQKMGYQIFLCDLKQLERQKEQLLNFLEEGHTVMLTFNFEGLGMEEHLYTKNKGYIWQMKHIPCFNIVVDHPMYYHDYISFLPPQYYHISIDRYHDSYMKKYYPYVKSIGFLPHAGSEIVTNNTQSKKDVQQKSFYERPFDVSFTGNYSSLEKCEPYFQTMGEEYSEFYHAVARQAIVENQRPLEEIMYEMVEKEVGAPTNLEFAQLMNQARFIDLYVRSFVRGRVIATLVDCGIQVHVFGDGWEELECLCPKNLIITKEISSYECLEVLSNTKIALNIMPWFKDGAHDRIFNSILNGAYCITDHSLYLDEVFSKEEVGFYDIDHLWKLPKYIKQQLEDIGALERKADKAYQGVKQNHTWEQRAKTLADIFETVVKG